MSLILDITGIGLFAVTVAFWVLFWFTYLCCCLIRRHRKQGQVSDAGTSKSTSDVDPTMLEVSGAYNELEASMLSTGSHRYADLQELENAGKDALRETFDGSRMPKYPAPPPPRQAPPIAKRPWQWLGNRLMGGLNNSTRGGAQDTEEENNDYLELDNTPDDADSVTAETSDGEADPTCTTVEDQVAIGKAYTSGEQRQDRDLTKKKHGVTLPFVKKTPETPKETDKDDDQSETSSRTSNESDDVTEDGYDITRAGSNISTTSGGFEPGARRSMLPGSDLAGEEDVEKDAVADKENDRQETGELYEDVTPPVVPTRINRT